MSGMIPIVSTESLARRSALFFVEGLFFGGVALVVANAVGVPQGGFFAIFLAAAGLTGRFDKLLDENRTGIYERRVPSWRVNAKTALSVLMMFGGVATACSCAALLWGEARLHGAFGFALDAAGLGADTLLTRRFSAGVLVHNYMVLAAFFVLAFVYRAYGALLALCWNACVWAMVLTILVARGAHDSSLPLAVFVPLAALALVPHLVIEAAAYVTGALAGIFLSKAVMAYGLGNPLFRRVARAVLVLLALAVAAIALGAGVEATLPAAVIARL